jgi:hypothetical protein
MKPKNNQKKEMEMESFDNENTNHLTCICERISTNE